jgi:hypothetical protein
MSFSLKQFLLLILFLGFALAALMNSEETFMIELVKLVAFGALVLTAYAAWVSAGERRAYCIGFVLWAGIYYLLFVVLRTSRIDLGTETLILWLGNHLESGRVIWAVYEKTAHLLFSLLFGIIGAWITVFFYRQRVRMHGKRG